MNELQLIKSARFGDITCDVYSDETDMFMTSEQLGACLGYTYPKKGIENIISRNTYLKDTDFSTILRMRASDGKMYNTRVFTEDGIYEITMLAKTAKAKDFRHWIRRLLKSLRKREMVVEVDEITKLRIQAQCDRAEAMLLNAQHRMIKLIMSYYGIDVFEKVASEIMGNRLFETIERMSYNG